MKCSKCDKAIHQCLNIECNKRFVPNLDIQCYFDYHFETHRHFCSVDCAMEWLCNSAKVIE